jgi:hypothetical protein
VKSKVGEGSTFEIYLPYVKDAWNFSRWGWP